MDDSLDCENCSRFYMKFVSCLKPKYQFSEYHRVGEMDYCPAYFGDWTVCLQAKLSSDEAKKKDLMMSTTAYQQYLKQESRRAPWEPKTTPRW